MSEDVGLGHVDGVVLGGQREALVEGVGRQGRLFLEEFIGLQPRFLALVGGVVAAGVERQR